VTGEIYEIEASELDWDAYDGDERDMGPETFYAASVEHPELGTLTWEVVEYPAGAENMKETDTGPHTIIKNFDYGLGDAGPDDEDEQDTGVDELVEWFFSRYEDPVHSLSYITAEGGYQWTEGGPHDASEVLQDNFPDVDFEVIQKAVEKIEEDGISDWARKRGAEDYDDDRPDDDGEPVDLSDYGAEIPEQSPGTQFGVIDGGLIGMVQAATPAPQLEKIDALIGECAVSVSQVIDALTGTNAHTDLLAEVHRYHAAINGTTVSIARLFAIGITIENMQAEIAVAVAAGERPELPLAAKSRLSAFLVIHSSVIAGTVEGREIIENTRFYAQTTIESQELLQRSRDITEALLQSSGLIDEDAKQEIAATTRYIGKGRDPKRSTAHGVSTTGNALKVILAVGLPTLGYVLLEGFAGTHVGSAVIQGTTAAMNTAFSAAAVAASEVAQTAGATFNAQVSTASELAQAAAAFVSKHLDTIRSYAAVAGSEMTWLSKLCDWVQAKMPKALKGN
jgi:hypothetical protein